MVCTCLCLLQKWRVWTGNARRRAGLQFSHTRST